MIDQQSHHNVQLVKPPLQALTIYTHVQQPERLGSSYSQVNNKCQNPFTQVDTLIVKQIQFITTATITIRNQIPYQAPWKNHTFNLEVTIKKAPKGIH